MTMGDNSVPARMGGPFAVSVAGEKLVAGTQKVMVAVTINDIGKIEFDINDNIA